MLFIPIIALNNLISTVICFLSLRKVYADRKQDPQNPVLKDFVWFYLFFGCFEFIGIGIKVQNLKPTNGYRDADYRGCCLDPTCKGIISLSAGIIQQSH